MRSCATEKDTGSAATSAPSDNQERHRRRFNEAFDVHNGQRAGDDDDDDDNDDDDRMSSRRQRRSHDTRVVDRRQRHRKYVALAVARSRRQRH